MDQIAPTKGGDLIWLRLPSYIRIAIGNVGSLCFYSLEGMTTLAMRLGNSG